METTVILLNCYNYELMIVLRYSHGWVKRLISILLHECLEVIALHIIYIVCQIWRDVAINGFYT